MLICISLNSDAYSHSLTPAYLLGVVMLATKLRERESEEKKGICTYLPRR